MNVASRGIGASRAGADGGSSITSACVRPAFVSVNTAKVSDEEVKYTTDAHGFITGLSKTLVGGLGEAVGINYVAREDRAALMRQLKRVGDQDYFERGIELAIEEDGLRFQPVDISDLYAVEIDFAEDLERANLFV